VITVKSRVLSKKGGDAHILPTKGVVIIKVYFERLISLNVYIGGVK
jgi:hypothetical protein